ncbi:MAG: VacJ family lipoprotein, partial [Deltaproteobacteria bacterium]|nr:VacJ family lipoprotein [Deltaproteobacteria bacterium]
MLKKVLFGFFIIVLVLTGCAHQPVADSSAKKNLSANDTEALNSESGNTEDEDLDFLYEEAEEGVSDVADPIAPWNKAMFHFNDKLYFWILKPVAIGYKTVMPTPAR